jgi:hypothetical protein
MRSAGRPDVTHWQGWIEPQPPTHIFGKPLEVPGADFSLSEADIVEMHRFVDQDVLPKFAGFFPMASLAPNSWGLRG